VVTTGDGFSVHPSGAARHLSASPPPRAAFGGRAPPRSGGPTPAAPAVRAEPDLPSEWGGENRQAVGSVSGAWGATLEGFRLPVVGPWDITE
jgi:hypothetical protein